MTLKEAFLQELNSQFPDVELEEASGLIADSLLSPFQLELPKAVAEEAQAFASALFQLRSQPSYTSLSQLNEPLSWSPAQNALLMSYDFHLDAQNGLRLIEVNTNASFLLMAHLLYPAHDLKPPFDFKLKSLQEDFENEWNSWGAKPDKLKSIAIVDERPQEQKLYIEFLLYQSWLKSLGYQAQIGCITELVYDPSRRQLFLGQQPIDLVYNRHTDFYLESEDSSALNQAYRDRAACVSPHPYEYSLMADKSLLPLWKKKGFFEKMGLGKEESAVLDRVIPEASILDPSSAEKLWEKRKNLFFKPLRSFGSRQTYRGASISRPAFEDLVKSKGLAQEFIPAPKRNFELAGQEHEMKFDLRFFVYRDKVELAIARLYQGQVTNTRTPLGGFAPIVFY